MNIIIKKFSYGARDRASQRGTDKFSIKVLNNCLVILLCKRIDSYDQIVTRSKFLSELMNISEIDEDDTDVIILHYRDYIGHTLVNDCYQLKEYIHLRKSHYTEENKPSKMKRA